MKKKSPYLDKLFSKMVSRKFLVWLTGTLLFVMLSVVYMVTTEFVEGNVVNHFADRWVELCILYIGSEAVIDAVSALRSRKKDISTVDTTEQPYQGEQGSDKEPI